MPNVEYFKTHPLRVARDRRKVTIGTVRKSEVVGVHSTKIHPTLGAYIHYGGVELADKLVMAHPSLPEEAWSELEQLWYASCGTVVKQLMFYVWAIITGELRHGTSAMCDKAFTGADLHPEAVTLCKLVTQNGKNVKSLLDDYGTVPAASYVDAVERHFRYGGWSGAYGGAKWADIALVFKQYLDGKSSAMLAADRAWTLVHNTGPIFNKGYYFTLHDHHLMDVLNAQATTSVFTLSSLMDQYEHPVAWAFKAFCTKAIAAIQTVEPEYEAGSGGGKNSDGSKFTLDSEGQQFMEDGVTKMKVGPYWWYTGANERDYA